MKSNDRIQEQERLSQYSQVSTLVYHILSIAGAGGLPENQAKQIYHEILDAYSTLNGDSFWLMRDELFSILVASDEQLKVKENHPRAWN